MFYFITKIPHTASKPPAKQAEKPQPQQPPPEVKPQPKPEPKVQPKPVPKAKHDAANTSTSSESGSELVRPTRQNVNDMSSEYVILSYL